MTLKIQMPTEPSTTVARKTVGSLRRQLLLATVSVQCVLVLGFVAVSVMQDIRGARSRLEQRLHYQADMLADAITSPLNANMNGGDMATVNQLLAVQSRAPSVHDVLITYADGQMIGEIKSPARGHHLLSQQELDAVRDITSTQVITIDGAREGVSPLDVHGKRAFVWIYPDNGREHALINSTITTGLWFALLAMSANAAISILLAQSVLKPVQRLVGGTRRVAEGAEPAEVFPLKITSNNEIGELSDAFNDMVESLEKQRSGLNDTLALLDSMLANAPVGFAFLDRQSRFVRVNQHLADMNGEPISRHLGHPVHDLLLPEFATAVERMSAHVFETGHALRDTEMVAGKGDPATTRSWIANFFPVRSSGNNVRWVGIIVSETTERKQAEEALRRTDKLAATGRLAASIAHEINNPLEGVTNLLYLLRHHSSLDDEARKYADMAQHEVARVSQITQQTLRFYKQSTLPGQTSLVELLDSVLVLYQGKIHASNIKVEKRYRGSGEVHALSGELRQLIANLLGNAVDAMGRGGRLVLRVSPSCDWATGKPGIRMVCADTGYGMDAATRKRIFEPFFTTKEATGTGLGLWVSAEILAKHSAKVRVKSVRCKAGKPGGTVFMVFFPEGGLEAASAAETARAAEPWLAAAAVV